MAYFECFDEGNDNYLDISGFPLLNPDEPYGVLTQFDNVGDALSFSATAYEASNGKYVSAGMIQEEYRGYLSK